MSEGYFQGAEYRIIRRCRSCHSAEVDVAGAQCAKCSMLMRRVFSKKAPWYRRLTLRAYVFLFVAVIAAMFGLAFFAASLR